MPKKPRAPSIKPRENLLGDNILHLLRQQDKSVRQFAKDISVYYKTALLWTQGRNVPDSISRQKICDYFGITEAQLFSKGLAVGTQGLEAEAAHNLIVKLGLAGMTPEDLLRLSEQDRELVKDLVKRLTSQRRQEAVETKAAAGSKDGAKTILIVDDEARLCQVLQAKFKELDYRVRIAADGLEAFRRMAEVKPDLIILDLRMVGMDGLDFLRKLRQDDAKTKVIVVSAYPDEVVNLHTENLKIEGFFDKPFPLEDLLDQVEKSMGRAA